MTELAGRFLTARDWFPLVNEMIPWTLNMFYGRLLGFPIAGLFSPGNFPVCRRAGEWASDVGHRSMQSNRTTRQSVTRQHRLTSIETISTKSVERFLRPG